MHLPLPLCPACCIPSLSFRVIPSLPLFLSCSSTLLPFLVNAPTLTCSDMLSSQILTAKICRGTLSSAAYAVSMGVLVMAAAPLIGIIPMASLAGVMLTVAFSTVQVKPTLQAISQARTKGDIESVTNLMALAAATAVCYFVDMASVSSLLGVLTKTYHYMNTVCASMLELLKTNHDWNGLKHFQQTKLDLAPENFVKSACTPVYKARRHTRVMRSALEIQRSTCLSRLLLPHTTRNDEHDHFDCFHCCTLLCWHDPVEFSFNFCRATSKF